MRHIKSGFSATDLSRSHLAMMAEKVGVQDPMRGLRELGFEIHRVGKTSVLRLSYHGKGIATLQSKLIALDDSVSERGEENIRKIFDRIRRSAKSVDSLAKAEKREIQRKISDLLAESARDGVELDDDDHYLIRAADEIGPKGEFMISFGNIIFRPALMPQNKTRYPSNVLPRGYLEERRRSANDIVQRAVSSVPEMSGDQPATEKELRDLMRTLPKYTSVSLPNEVHAYSSGNSAEVTIKKAPVMTISDDEVVTANLSDSQKAGAFRILVNMLSAEIEKNHALGRDAAYSKRPMSEVVRCAEEALSDFDFDDHYF